MSKAKINKLRLYCYADETGQHTQGKIFIVAVIITKGEKRERLERQLERLERESGKGTSKWKRTSVKRKADYLSKVLQVNALQDYLFYGLYRNTKDYLRLVGETIAKAIQERTQDKDYQATIYIHGLQFAERQKVRPVLKEFNIRVRKLGGLRDKSSAFIRLADALAGFIREYEEGDSYAQRLFQAFKAKRFIVEVK